MVAFAFVVSEPLRELSAAGVIVLAVALLLYVCARIVHFGVLLGQSLRVLDQRVWRKVLIAAVIAVLASATLSAFPVECNFWPPWTLEYWWYCSGR